VAEDYGVAVSFEDNQKSDIVKLTSLPDATDLNKPAVAETLNDLLSLTNIILGSEDKAHDLIDGAIKRAFGPTESKDSIAENEEIVVPKSGIQHFLPSIDSFLLEVLQRQGDSLEVHMENVPPEREKASNRIMASAMKAKSILEGLAEHSRNNTYIKTIHDEYLPLVKENFDLSVDDVVYVGSKKNTQEYYPIFSVRDYLKIEDLDPQTAMKSVNDVLDSFKNLRPLKPHAQNTFAALTPAQKEALPEAKETVWVQQVAAAGEQESGLRRGGK
jgi:hypothetical protein